MNMSEARYVLDVEIVRNHPKSLLCMCKEAYIKRVMEHFQMQYPKLVHTLIRKGLTLNLNQCLKTDDEKERMRDIP